MFPHSSKSGKKQWTLDLCFEISQNLLLKHLGGGDFDTVIFKVILIVTYDQYD